MFDIYNSELYYVLEEGNLFDNEHNCYAPCEDYGRANEAVDVACFFKARYHLHKYDAQGMCQPYSHAGT